MRRRTVLSAPVPIAAAVLLAAAATGCGASSRSAPPSSDGAGTRTVHTAMGDVKVPKHPKRVVVLDTNELDDSLTLGVKPVGATRADVNSGFLDYLPKSATSGIANVGTIGQPNLEAIDKLHPDLILSNKNRDAKNYPNLSKIAPTVLTRTTGVTWKSNFTVHAAALGRQARAEQVEGAYAAHAAKVRKAIGSPAQAERTKVSVVRFVEGAPTRLYCRGSYIGTILDDIGVGRPAAQSAKDKLMVEISPENVDRAGGDVLFHGTYGSASKSGETSVTGGAQWKRLAAVKSGKSFAVDDQLWFQGIGYTAANKILDQLQARLAPKQ